MRNESLNVLNRQIANGGIKEEARTIVENGRRINRTETGEELTIAKQDDGTYSATANTHLPATPLLPGEEITATIHSHPTKVLEKNGQVFPFSANVPSAADNKTFGKFKTNIIVGPISGDVTRDSSGKINDNRANGIWIFNINSRL